MTSPTRRDTSPITTFALELNLFDLFRNAAFTIAQDEASCVAFGMPREPIVLGAVDEILALSRIPGAILQR